MKIPIAASRSGLQTAVLITVSPYAGPMLARELAKLRAPVELIACYGEGVLLALSDAAPRDAADCWAQCLDLLIADAAVLACPSAAARRGFQSRAKARLEWCSLPSILERAGHCDLRLQIGP